MFFGNGDVILFISGVGPQHNPMLGYDEFCSACKGFFGNIHLHREQLIQLPAENSAIVNQ
jgi:hypothetical protein